MRKFLPKTRQVHRRRSASWAKCTAGDWRDRRRTLWIPNSKCNSWTSCSMASSRARSDGRRWSRGVALRSECSNMQRRCWKNGKLNFDASLAVKVQLTARLCWAWRLLFLRKRSMVFGRWRGRRGAARRIQRGKLKQKTSKTFHNFHPHLFSPVDQPICGPKSFTYNLLPLRKFSDSTLSESFNVFPFTSVRSACRWIDHFLLAAWTWTFKSLTVVDGWTLHFVTAEYRKY